MGARGGVAAGQAPRPGIDASYAPTSQARAIETMGAAAGSELKPKPIEKAPTLCALEGKRSRTCRPQRAQRLHAALLAHYETPAGPLRVLLRQQLLQSLAQMGDVGP